MSLTTCAGCNRHFTHAGYSRHISMTKRTVCRAIHDRRVDLRMVHNRRVVSAAAGPVDGNPGEGLC